MIDDSEIERCARALLLESAEGLCGAARSRLTQARHAALRARTTPLRYRLQRWAPAGAMAAAVLTLLVMFVPHGRPPASTPGLNGAIEDLDLLTSDVPLTTDQPDQAVDVEFYEWAVAAARDGGSPANPDAAQAAADGT